MRFCLRTNLSESKLSVIAALVRLHNQKMRTRCLPAGQSVRDLSHWQIIIRLV